MWRHYQRADTYPVVADEYAQAFTAAARSALTAQPFPPLPVVVIYHDAAVVIKEIVEYGGLSAAEAGQVEGLWEALTREYLALTPQEGRWQVAPGASHMIHLDRPDLVAAVIAEMVVAVQAIQEAG